MSEIITINNLPMNIADEIVEIQDHSDEFINRARVVFKNGLYLSVIKSTGGGLFGGLTYGLEIAIMQEDNGDSFFRNDLYLEDDNYDQVIGHCDQQKVEQYMAIAAAAQRVSEKPKSPWEMEDDDEGGTLLEGG